MQARLISGLRPRLRLSLAPIQAAALGQQIAQTDKAAEGVTSQFKSRMRRPCTSAPTARPALSRAARGRAQGHTPPALPEVVAAVEEKAPELEMEVEDAPEESYEPAIGDMTPDEFGALLDARLAPLIKALDIAGKMGGHMDELNSMMGGVATKEAGLASEVAALKTQVAELAGDAPRVLAGGYRASAAAATVVPDGDARLKEASAWQRSDHGGVWRLLSDLADPGARDRRAISRPFPTHTKEQSQCHLDS